MNSQPNDAVRELGSMRLRLRGDLICTPQLENGQPYYMVEDPIHSRFFRLGPQEYAFVSLLAEETTISEAFSRLSSVQPDHQLTASSAATICHWLIQTELAQPTESTSAACRTRAAQAQQDKRDRTRWNPVALQIPFGCPDGLFASLTRWFGWLHSPFMITCVLVLALVGAYCLAADATRFASTAHVVFSPGNWLWLAACWMVLKVVHECGHGMVCKRYGGSVRETGVMLIMLAPLAYVDVTSSWRFRSRWRRIHVAAAGMYVELFIAAVAAIAWSCTSDGWLNNLCYNLVVMAGVTTVVFNANPLMKFDGYYILSDLLGLPNLYVNGQQSLNNWARRNLLGLKTASSKWPRGKRLVIGIYGVASFLWRILVCIGLLIVAATLFKGAGVVLAAIALLMWVGTPLWRLCKYLATGGDRGERPQRGRLLAVVALGFGLAAIVLFGAPWPGACTAPAIIDYAPLSVVRAASPGFARQICVRSGQRVAANDLLVVLENRELNEEVARLELELQQSQIRSRQLERQGRLAACQAEAKQSEALRTQLREKRAQTEQLRVRAPRDGQVLTPNVEHLEGTYLAVGDVVMNLGEEDRKELRISISQDDLEAFAERSGRDVRVDLPGRSLLSRRLAKVIPRASVQLPNEALASVHGGPLAVRSVSAETQNGEAELQLLSPRFTGVVQLTAADSRMLRAGQIGRVWHRPVDASIGAHLYRRITRWLRDRLAAAGQDS